jgi:hypothetical protein
VAHNGQIETKSKKITFKKVAVEEKTNVLAFNFCFKCCGLLEIGSVVYLYIIVQILLGVGLCDK